MDRGAWQAIVHGVAKSWTQLSTDTHTHTHASAEVKEAEVDQFYEEQQDLLELTPKKRCPFHRRRLKCKSRKSRVTWSNRQVWP